MIDTNQLSALVSAFRVETEKEIISPEPSARQSLQHESLRQLWCANSKPLSNRRQTLAGHSRLARYRRSDTERKILDDWKHRACRTQSKACFGSAEAQPMLRYANALLSQYTVVYDVAHATGMADMEHMFLTLKGRSQYSTWLRRWLA